jgi:hypothetical protein
MLFIFDSYIIYLLEVNSILKIYLRDKYFILFFIIYIYLKII